MKYLSRWLAPALVIISSFGVVTFTGNAHATNLLEVYEDALESDPVLGAAQAGYAASKEAYPQARAGLLPSLNTNAFANRNSRDFPELPSVIVTADEDGNILDARRNPEGFSSSGWTAELRQPLINAERWMRLRSAKASVTAAKHDLVNTENEVIVRVVQAYLDVLRAQDLLDSTLAEEAAVKRQLEQVQQRFEVGLVAITDVLESQAAYDNAVVRRIQADGDHEIFFITLSTLTGQAYEALDRISEELPIIDPNPKDEDSWVKDALSNNPGIQAAQEQLSAARRSAVAARTASLPTLDAVVSKTRNLNDSFNFFGVEITEQTVWGVELSLPLYNGGNLRSQTREARALTTQAREQLTNEQLSVTRDTRNLYRAVATDVVRVKARLKAIASAQSALEATETGYEVGTRNIVDVLQAQQRLYSSQFDYADSRYNYIVNLMRLKQRSGSLTEEDLTDLNNYADPNDQVVRLISLRNRNGDFSTQ